jgi:transposase InsO family protein
MRNRPGEDMVASRSRGSTRCSRDTASEFRSGEFERAVARLEARHLFIRAGRP